MGSEPCYIYGTNIDGGSDSKEDMQEEEEEEQGRKKGKEKGEEWWKRKELGLYRQGDGHQHQTNICHSSTHWYNIIIEY